MALRRQIFRLRAFWDFISFFGRHICLVVMVIYMVTMVQPIRANWLFVAMAVFNHIRKCLLRYMFAGQRCAIVSNISLLRLQVFCLSFRSCSLFLFDVCLIVSTS